MSEHNIKRSEWDSYSDAEKFQYVQLTENEAESYRQVLSEIPECSDHGFCLPHFRDWIRAQQGLPVGDIDVVLPMRMFDRAVRDTINKSTLGG